VQAITVRDRDAGVGGLSLTDMPCPHAAQNDVIVRVHAGGFTPGELDWPTTWADRSGRDRTPSVPGHELSGIVVELGYGTTGLTVGQRVFGLTDWTRNGSLAEYTAVEARNLAPLPADVDHTVAAALPIAGLTAWQGLIDHARLTTGQTVLIHGAAGGVGSIAVQLARDVGALVIGTGRAADRDTATGLGVDAFLDLPNDLHCAVPSGTATRCVTCRCLRAKRRSGGSSCEPPAGSFCAKNDESRACSAVANHSSDPTFPLALR
jgi:NADPH:quinone reductase-like Zn-dependent oxidoreductase